jgi:hypothetical protein
MVVLLSAVFSLPGLAAGKRLDFRNFLSFQHIGYQAVVQ